MSFSNVKDQDIAIRLLRNVINRRRVPNAMLFWGPEGVGKTMAALETAKAINCKQKTGDACDECLSCQRIAHGNHPDVMVVVPKRNTRVIPIDAIKDVCEFAALYPQEASQRVFIIEDADRMNESAQNHFLKTLEEPPGRSLFILVSAHPRELLPTIRSRCLSVRFRALRVETVAGRLKQERGLPDALATAIAALSQGQMNRALEFVDSDKRDVVLGLVDQLYRGGDPVEVSEEFVGLIEGERKRIEKSVNAEFPVDKKELSPEDVKDIRDQRLAALNAALKRDILDYLYLFESWYRDELVLAATGDRTRLLNRDWGEKIRAQLGSEPGAKVHAIDRARGYLDSFIPEDRVFRDMFFALSKN
jgi:DNA polymerase III subunit delta'